MSYDWESARRQRYKGARLWLLIAFAAWFIAIALTQQLERRDVPNDCRHHLYLGRGHAADKLRRPLVPGLAGNMRHPMMAASHGEGTALPCSASRLIPFL